MTVVIPWRDTGCPHRARNVAYTAAYYQSHGHPVIIADDPAHPVFNVSAARNRGLEQAATELVYVIDADVIVPQHQLEQAGALATSTGSTVTCYSAVTYLTEKGTRALRDGRTPDGPGDVERVGTTPFGGANALTKTAHQRVGGWDEGFVGWGHEDSEFNERADATVGHRVVRGNAYHQWHPIADRSHQPTNHARWMASRKALAVQREPLSIVRRVRPGEDNEELRYSNRSLDNFPHRDVWIIGHKPRWVTNVHHLPGDRHASKWLNVFDGIVRACENPDISDPFVLWDDDVYAWEPIWRIETLHKGPLARLVDLDNPGSEWKHTLANTYQWCVEHGVDAPLSYELHTPFMVDKAMMLAVAKTAKWYGGKTPPQLRSCYGNLYQIGGRRVPDVKLGSWERRLSPQSGFLSTSDESFARIRRTIRERFPEPSRYEEGGR